MAKRKTNPGGGKLPPRLFQPKTSQWPPLSGPIRRRRPAALRFERCFCTACREIPNDFASSIFVVIPFADIIAAILSAVFKTFLTRKSFQNNRTYISPPFPVHTVSVKTAEDVPMPTTRTVLLCLCILPRIYVELYHTPPIS